jgi:hypothetical protein
MEGQDSARACVGLAIAQIETARLTFGPLAALKGIAVLGLYCGCDAAA